MTTPQFLDTGPDDARYRLLLAHGAGAAMDSPFLNLFAQLMADRDIAISRFEFEYMAARRVSPNRKPPPKAETLVQHYENALQTVRGRMTPGQHLFIGGKSMGGRVASLIADQLHNQGRTCGLVCLGYPFHPPKKPEQLRITHLAELTCPALIVQGERDPFGTRAEIEAMPLAPAIAFHWASDGDHDLGPRGASGFTRRANLELAANAVAAFCKTADG